MAATSEKKLALIATSAPVDWRNWLVDCEVVSSGPEGGVVVKPMPGAVKSMRSM